MATAKLNKDIFGLSVDNHELVKLAYDAYLANSRSSHAKTLKRGEVRGGGKHTGIRTLCLPGEPMPLHAHRLWNKRNTYTSAF